ncbi:MAG TPA: hypothetical protein VNI83_06355, partial [Vicinamibacterales bacterium]|nr:hypothetical protein [Vicinamibacterales bacterium]
MDTTSIRGLAPSVVLLLAAVGCSSRSPSAPSTPAVVAGRAVSVVDGAGAAGVSVQIGSRASTRTDDEGRFRVELAEAGTYPAVLAGGSFVERRTSIAAPAEAARLSLIPTSFDLRAFDEMCRTSNQRLQRWTTRPALVVLKSVMAFGGPDAIDFRATGERLSEAEAEALAADLAAGLALLTAGTYRSFATVTYEEPRPNAMVSTIRDGFIVAGRYDGVMTWIRTVGYGRWAERPDGAVVAGAIYLDRDFDAASDRRWLLRAHELGHALGYTHVTSRRSLMNPAIGPEPTEFDRQAAALAFDRPPGNRSPDVDPGASGLAAATALSAGAG